MKYFLSFLLVTTLSFNLSFAQTFKVSSHNTTTGEFRLLLQSNTQIEANDTANERILDLVNPVLRDSMPHRKWEHHQLFLVGWLIHAFGGYNWRAISPVKQKIVGTVNHNSRSSEEEFTEYDVNYDLNFHLKKYLWLTFDAYDRQKKIGKQDFRGKKHRTDYAKSPFQRDTNDIDITRYRMHCELTPPAAFRPQLHYLFYPTQPGLSLKEHPNFGTDHPSMGFYGTPCLDCNHNCHPEIHPYEWAWWLDLHSGPETDKIWLIGLFHESSNRFKHWSKNPMTGRIAIPFAYQFDDAISKVHDINIEHLVFNRFMDNELSKYEMPDSTIDVKHEHRMVKITDGTTHSFSLRMNFKNALPTDGLKYYFSDLNWDEQSHILSGYLNFATSVTDLYTVKIIFKDR
ncbi:MAG: hypothetical protein JWO06_673 [Bacteroidota bacterium]|nr:hypothetical protein [Bacteroidota bacterium]